MYKNRNKIRLLLITLITVLLAICINPPVVSKSLEQKAIIGQQNSLNLPQYYEISQNFLTIDFNNNYYSQLALADEAYKQGDLVKVEQIQRQVKPDFAPAESFKQPKVDPEQLVAGRRLWDRANEGMEQDLESKVLINLEQLLKLNPDFVPGHLLLVDAYEKYEKEEEALTAVIRLGELYPELPQVADKKIDLLIKNKKYLEASIASAQFAIMYPEHPEAERYRNTAAEYRQKYVNNLKIEMTANVVLGTIINTLLSNDETVTEQGFYPLALVLNGEVKTGKALAEQYKQQLDIVTDTPQSTYVNEIGQKLAQFMGRDEFEYEFYIVNDPNANAFALPGGKIFINTGILELIDSESELAGILSHEISHSVLSHSFQRIGLANLFNLIPIEELKAIASAQYSQSQEKESDIVGTQVLAAAGYSADGIYNVMAKLAQLEQKSNWSTSLLSSHPASTERMEYIEKLIQTNGYKRYAYEGVEEYQAIFP